MTTHQEQTAALVRVVNEAGKNEDRNSNELPIGYKLYVSCAGMVKRGIKPGHVVRIDTHLGDGKWEKGDEWVSQTIAESRGVKAASTTGHCPSCSKFVDDYPV